MREFLKAAEESLKTPTQKPQQPVVTKPPVDQPEQIADDKLVRIAQDFYKSAGKQMTEQKAQEVANFYKGDYERMLKDLYKSAGKTLTPERVKSVKEHYKLVEDVPNTELPKEVLDYNSQIDKLDENISTFESYSGSLGADSPRMGSPAGFEEAKSESIQQFNQEKEQLTDSFDFKPITLKEVVNSLGKNKDDIDEVAQTSKLYLEKYTGRMSESLDRYEKTLPKNVQRVIGQVKNGEAEVDANDFTDSDVELYNTWKQRYDVLSKQKDINNSTIYKRNDFRREYNNVAREAKDRGESVRNAILAKAKELGDNAQWIKTLETKGENADLNTWASTSGYNTMKRVVNTLQDTWRGVKEAFDGWDEKSTTYNESFMKDFEKYLDNEVAEDIERLMFGVNKSKYDGDIHEKRVDVNGVKLILDGEGEAVGIRRKNGDMAFSFTEDEVNALKEYEANKEELKKGAYDDLRMGTLGAKGTQVMTDMVPIIGATLATAATGGSTSPMLGTLLGTYLVTYGDYYDQQFAKTGSVGNATAFASVATSLQAMLEGLGGIEGSIIKNASKKAVNQAVVDAAEEVAVKNVVNGKTAMSAFMKHLGKQMLEETGIEISQSLSDAYTEILFNGETDLSWKELEEVVLLTPFATAPIAGAMSANSFKNFSMENLKIAAKKKDLFNKLVDEWVGAAKTPEQKAQRQEEADFKKGVVEELSQSLVAVDELGIVDPNVSKKILDKSVEIVEKKKQIKNAKSDQAKGVYENELSKLQSEVQELVQKGYDKKSTLDELIDRAEKEMAERDARLKTKEKESNKLNSNRTENDFENSKESYRIIVGDEAFNDIVESGVVRTNSKNKGKKSGGIDLSGRPTLYPSFSRGKASMEYAANNPNHYIIVTEDPSIQPSKVGRHGKGTTMFPTDENGNHLQELSGEKVKVYKHMGNGKYSLVYENGKLIEDVNKFTPLHIVQDDKEREKAEKSKIKSEALNDVESTTKAIELATINNDEAWDEISGFNGVDSRLYHTEEEVAKAYHESVLTPLDKKSDEQIRLESAVERLLAPKVAKKREFEEVKNDPEFQRLNIVPDNDKTKVRPHNLPTAADFEAIYDEGVDESEIGGEPTTDIEAKIVGIERRRQEELNERVVYDRKPTVKDGEFRIVGDPNKQVYRINEFTGRLQVKDNETGLWTVEGTHGKIELETAQRSGFEKVKENINAKYDAEIDEELSKLGSGKLTLKVAPLPTEFNDQGEITTDAVVVDADGKTKAQFIVYGDTPVVGAIEVDAMVDEDLQGQGIGTKAYQAIANKSGKPIIPASINRDYRGEKSSSTLSKASALFWKASLDNGTAEEVEVTTREGKVIRTVAILPEGFKSTETVKKIEDTGVEDSNVESEAFEQKDEVEVDMEKGTFVLNRRGVPVTYKILEYKKNKEGEIVSIKVEDPTGKKKTIRAKEVVAEIVREKIIHENKLIENEITEEELLRATAESGARTSEQLSSERTDQDIESDRKEQEFREGTREDILKQSVNYQGVQGKLYKEEDGSYYVLSTDGEKVFVEGGESTATNEELGITKGKTNVQLVEESIKNAYADRKAIRERLFDLFWDIQGRIPASSVGAFERAFFKGGDNVISVASQLVKALKFPISQPIRNAVGDKRIKEAENLAAELKKLDKTLSNKNLKQLRSDARVLDAKAEAKQLKAERKAKEAAARKRSEEAVKEGKAVMTVQTVSPKSVAGNVFSLRELSNKLKRRFGIPTKIISKENSFEEIQKRYPQLMFSKNTGSVQGAKGNVKKTPQWKEIEDFAKQIGFKVAKTKDKNYSVYFDSLAGIIYINDLTDFDVDVFKSAISGYYNVNNINDLVEKIREDSIPPHDLLKDYDSDLEPSVLYPFDLNEVIIDNLINLGKIDWYAVSFNPTLTESLLNKYYPHIIISAVITNPGISFKKAFDLIDIEDTFFQDGIRLAQRDDFTTEGLRMIMDKMGFANEVSFIQWAAKQDRLYGQYGEIYTNPILLDLVLKYADELSVQNLIGTDSLTKELYLEYKDKIDRLVNEEITTTDNVFWIGEQADKHIIGGTLLSENKGRVANLMYTEYPTEDERVEFLVSGDAFVHDWQSVRVTDKMIEKLLPQIDEKELSYLAANPKINPAVLLDAFKKFAGVSENSEYLKSNKFHDYVKTILSHSRSTTLNLILENVESFSLEDVIEKLASYEIWDREPKRDVLEHFWNDIKPRIGKLNLYHLLHNAPSSIIIDYFNSVKEYAKPERSLISLKDIKLPKGNEVSHIFPLYTSRGIDDIVNYWVSLWLNGQSTIESATTMGPDRQMENIRGGQARVVFAKTANFTGYSPNDNYSRSISTDNKKLVQVKTATRSSVHTEPSEINDLLTHPSKYGHDEWLIRLTPGSIDRIEYRGEGASYNNESTLPESLKKLNEFFGIKVVHHDIHFNVVETLEGNKRALILSQRANDGSVRGFYNRVTGEAVLVDGEANPTTAIHEAFSHPFVEKAKTDNPKLYNKLLAESKKHKDIVKAVDGGYTDSTQEDRNAEYITHAIDKYVNKELDKNKDKSLIEAIEAFFKYISDELKKILNIDTTVGDLSPNLTLQDLAQYALYGEGKIDLTPTKTITKQTQKPKEKTDVIDNTVWDAYQRTGIVPDSVLQGVADHKQNGTQMSDRQFTIYNNKTAEINKILSERDAEGSYPRKDAAKATADAMSIIDRRNNQIGRVLKSLGYTQDQINSTITVFNQVAKRWAKKNNRPIEDFYSDVFKGIEVADLGEGRRGRTVSIDGGYMIQLMSGANAATPVHELAHIMEKFLNNKEKQDVLDWLGKDKWDRSVSEAFAKGFEQWLMKSEDVPDLDAFKRFKEWLMDIYKGIIVWSGQALPTFTPEVKSLYSNLLKSDIPEHTKKAYSEAVGKNNTMFDRMKKQGIQFKKAVFEDVLSKISGESQGFRRFAYLPRTRKRLAQQAVMAGYTNPVNAVQFAATQMGLMMDNPDYLPSTTAEQLVGYGYALMLMEQSYEAVVAKRKRSPKDQDLLQIQDELSKSIQELGQILSLARSNAGLVLNIGSQSMYRSMYSPEVLTIQTEKRWGRKTTDSEKAEIARQSKYLQADMERLKKALEDANDSNINQIRALAEQLVSQNFENSPLMNEAIKIAKSKTERKRSADLKTEFDKISKMLSEKPDMLLTEDIDSLYDEDSSDAEFFRSMRNFISLLIASNENIDSFEKLAESIQEYWPSLDQDKLLNVIVWSDPAYQKAKGETLASVASIIREESKLLDQLRTYLTESYQDIEKTGNKKIFPERLQKLEKLISQILVLSATDYTIDFETFSEAMNHLESLQSIYAGLALEKVTFESPNLEDMISKVREYESARKLSMRQKQLTNLEGIVKQLNEGTYEGSLSDIVPEKLDRHVDSKLEEISNRIGVNKEVIKSFKEKSNRNEIIKRIGTLLQKNDGGESIRSLDTVYEAIKRELPEVTKEEVYNAILHKADSRVVNERLKEARNIMKKEVNALGKLQNFLKKPLPKSNTPAILDPLQTELNDLISEIEKFVKHRYEDHSDWKIGELSRKLDNIRNNYADVISGGISAMSLEDIVKEVQAIKDQETTEALTRNLYLKRTGTAKTELYVNFNDNIFDLVPELLPKFITEDNKILKRKLSDEIKHERLLRVNRVLDVVKNLISSNDIKKFTDEKGIYHKEIESIRKFLDIEKKSKDVKAELIRINREVYHKRKVFNDWIEEKYLKETTAKVKAFVNTPRLLVLAGDISFVTYQFGVMSVTHPIISAKAFGKMAYSAFSEKKWQNQMADFQLNPFYDVAISSGLKLVDETSLTFEEELQLTSILESWPYVRVPARMLRKFGQRIYSTYANHVRLSTFVEGIKSLDSVQGGYIGKDKNFYEDETKFIAEKRQVLLNLAEDINTHTGSASVFTTGGSFDEGLNNFLNSSAGVLIAPRLYASVIKAQIAMTGVPDFINLYSLRNKPSDDPMKAFYKYRLGENMKRMAGVVGWHLTMLAMFTGIISGLFGGDDDEMEELRQTTLNPYHSQFLKVKSGQRVFSISPFVSYYRYAARVGFQAAINDGAEDLFERSRTMESKTGFIDHTWDFFKFRFNPAIPAFIEAGIMNRDWNGEKISKHSLWSEDFGWALLDRTGAVAKRSLAPIWGQGIIDNINRKTLDQIPGEFLIDFSGINSYTVEPYQSNEVQNFLDDKKFRLSYTRVKIPKSISDPEEIKAKVKMEFGEWLQSEIANGKNPSKEQMQKKNDQLMRQIIIEAR